MWVTGVLGGIGEFAGKLLCDINDVPHHQRVSIRHLTFIIQVPHPQEEGAFVTGAQPWFVEVQGLNEPQNGMSFPSAALLALAPASGELVDRLEQQWGLRQIRTATTEEKNRLARHLRGGDGSRR